jgi:hypothetical protein
VNPIRVRGAANTNSFKASSFESRRRYQESYNDYEPDYSDYVYEPDYSDYVYEPDYSDYVYGFSPAEQHELMCQGVKPWDEDAHAVMGAMRSSWGY